MNPNEVITTNSDFAELTEREYVVYPSIPRDSPITEFYAGKTVFLTGPTGFLGQLLLEKLLRIGTKHIYVLMRSKKNRDSRERLEKVCRGPVFQHLHKHVPNFLDRIEIITGDLSQRQLGIHDNAILTKLKENVEIVIHAAADVRFNEPLYNLIWCNLVGTRDLLELSTKMKKLQVFVYMSTAFSNTKANSKNHMKEEFYEPPMNADILIDFVVMHQSESDKEMLNIIAPNLIEPWPNNYTFSKALSESMVRRYGIHFPIAVIRPTIVISTFADPIVAWTNSYGGMNGVVAGIGGGLLRNLFYKSVELNIVCADFCTNGALAIAWHTFNEYGRTQFEAKIYHINRVSDSALIFDNTVSYLVECGRKLVAPMNCVWYPVCQKTYSDLHDNLLIILYQAIPSMIMDLFIKSKYKLTPIVRKMLMFSDVIKFFIHNEFVFDNDNLFNVIDRMTEYDRKYYICDPRIVDWKKYYVIYVIGARKHLLDDSFDNYKQAYKRMHLLKYLHYSVKYTFIAVILFIFYKLFLKKYLM
ncbi:fatty acyl-CoA reductase wat-like [Contarinia nasturtii]|uniref:fatty acyl-CoA reductase wat-like n=1 Tax=Contarinia nasturtii TaxID=265458 RepID=UPI0012D44637|nr:fatty acyl-CoA reductase wat-like [Contarinia nasturtii]